MSKYKVKPGERIQVGKEYKTSDSPAFELSDKLARRVSCFIKEVKSKDKAPIKSKDKAPVKSKDKAPVK